MNSKRNIWQIIQAIVAVISLFYAVYKHTQTEIQKKIDAKTITRLTEDLIGARKLINTYNENFITAQISLDSIAPLLVLSAMKEDSLIKLANKYKIISESQISELDENPMVIYISDDEHFDLFFLWTDRYKQLLKP